VPTDQVWEVFLLPDVFVCFDRMSEKCVAGSGVVSPSSCSFLLMVDEVLNKTPQARPCDHMDVVCTLPFVNI